MPPDQYRTFQHVALFIALFWPRVPPYAFVRFRPPREYLDNPKDGLYRSACCGTRRPRARGLCRRVAVGRDFGAVC